MRSLYLASFVFAAAACQSVNVHSAQDERQARGLAFARTTCAGCHAVEKFGESRNQDAPPFARIANEERLTSRSLSEWLRNAHNYPQQMNFTIDTNEVDDLVAYMLTLRDPNYRPAI